MDRYMFIKGNGSKNKVADGIFAVDFPANSGIVSTLSRS